MRKWTWCWKTVLVLEDRSGRVAAVEVKFSETLNPRDAKGILQLRETLGKKFVRGAVFYLGPQTVPLAENILALPVSYLFSPYVKKEAK